MVRKVISHYKILQKIGQGGMGEVYKAEDTRLRRVVAIKTLKPESAGDEKRKKRLLAEARAASALNHPNICTVYEIDEDDGTLFIVMEYVKGKPLSETISQAPMELVQALNFAVQIGEALQKAHQRKIVHRDIKPSNILITEEGQIKILDFGLARLVEDVHQEALSNASTLAENLTESGIVVGTIPYMSPEQIKGKKVDARSDIFSFGIVFYQMLTGMLPFKGDTLFEVMSSILTQRPEPPTKRNPKISAAVERIMEKVLEKDLNDRYFSMNDVVADLKNAMHQQPKKAYGSEAESSVAVLYFENLSAEKEEEYFRDGMTEDVITELSKIKNLRVFPRSAVLAFRDKPTTTPQVIDQLTASHLLTGSLRRSGKRLRITAQLVETVSGHSIWAERYDREMKDVFELQDEIARSIAAALRITLSPQEELEIAGKPTENMEAYDYYLRGRNYSRRATQPDLDTALKMFEKAVLLQADFALAHAGISNVSSILYHWFGEQPYWIEKAIQSCDRALDLNPELPEGLAARATICLVQGKYDESIRLANDAINRKADCEGAYWTLGRALFYKDQWEEAAAIALKAIDASGDDYNVYIPYVHALQKLGETQLANDLIEKQLQTLKRHLEWVPDDARARLLFASRKADLGLTEEAIQELEKGIALHSNDAGMLYNAACTYGILNRKKEALACLERAVAAGFRNVGWAERDPDLACVHNDQKFKLLMNQIRQMHTTS